MNNYGPSEDITQLLDVFVIRYPEASYGPAHIVLDDYNLDDGLIMWCQRLIKEAILHRLGETVVDPDEVSVSLNYYDIMENDEQRHSLEELGATYEFLDLLLEIPEDERDW